MARKRSADNLDTWKVLLQLARPYGNRFVLIALLALLGTGADLLQPLIYRTAINDVAGLFVDRVVEKAGPPVAPTEAQPSPIRDQQLDRLEKTQLPHRPDYVAPRTRRQALSTLLWAVALLFAISVIGYFLSLAADQQSTAVACAIESNLIRATFGHVLRLPLSFFNRRASGGLARRIDQSDQVAPIVSALARQIAPEVLRIAGICAIMLTQS
ncbi:MAG: ABC transporter transmembrane domain-containing protein, partial [Candidatus Solibacter sp.]|nr:ABC transporter transmembrane domain-containing protein [Candidatus Solibacter sp.]